MSGSGSGLWRDPMQVQQLYLISAETRINERIGHCWAEGRLRPGDIVLCNELSGDCFYNFFLMDWAKYANRRTVEMNTIPYQFGAYALNAPKLEGMTPRDYHLLMAGERVRVHIALPAWVFRLPRA